MIITRNVLFLALALAVSPAFAAQDISKVNGSITAEAGQTYGELQTVNGAIRISAGASTQDAGTVNGSINVGKGANTGGLETVNGSIRVDRDVTVDGGIETVNGGVFVDRGGRVKGGVETVNGSIGLVGTQLGKGIQTVGGDITVGADSVVRGGIKIQKNQSWLKNNSKRDPRVIIGPNAVVEGPLVFDRPVSLHVHRSARIGPVTGASARIFEGDVAPKD